MDDSENQNGGGSGGGAVDRREQFRGNFGIAANAIDLVSRPGVPPTPGASYLVNIVAAGTGMDGNVNVRGTQSVRVTTGPPPLPATSASDNGFAVEVGETHSVTIKRGLIPMADQSIEMTNAGIMIDAGMGELKIQSLTTIELSCCDGVCSIKLTPAAIILQGPIIMIN